MRYRIASIRTAVSHFKIRKRDIEIPKYYTSLCKIIYIIEISDNIDIILVKDKLYPCTLFLVFSMNSISV